MDDWLSLKNNIEKLVLQTSGGINFFMFVTKKIEVKEIVFSI